MWMSVVVSMWYQRCSPTWTGKRKHTSTSLANTISASTTWKEYPVNGVGTLDLSVRVDHHFKWSLESTENPKTSRPFAYR